MACAEHEATDQQLLLTTSASPSRIEAEKGIFSSSRKGKGDDDLYTL
ncbi:MAG: hypothetical protein MZV63_52620 [Marinilabiliales bacterium]|nr:hypothetical protein [Marinilabiliales bacterium]